MITLSMISFLVGAALGQRFKVLVLMPALAIVLVLAVATGVTHALTAWSMVLMVATTATCLQVGYFVGIGIRPVLEAAISRNSSSPSSVKTPARHAAR